MQLYNCAGIFVHSKDTMKKSKYIYYLDVENEDLYFFKHAIEGLGHKISIYRDGHKMMQDLSKSETKPDILFLGSNMPILQGKELIMILKNSKELNHIPVIIITSALPRKLMKSYADAGIKHIMKRTHPEDYSVAFKEVLEMKFA
ncbi:response regulator [Flavobacterium terrisoli]|uniref:response regulator n=1 Tax=Flavobacterium terrisoli TaxID=3242195 RepID=UPI0025428904|nr:response regulator [Flavobacterium buctense]